MKKILIGLAGIALFASIGVSGFTAYKLSQIQPQEEQSFGSFFSIQPDQKSAFGDLMVAENTTQIDIKYNYNINPAQATTTNSGAGATSQINNMAQVSTGSQTNSTSTITSLNVLRYSAGEGAELRFTALLTKCKSGSNQYIGLLDDNDGYAFGCQDDKFGILRRQNGTDFFTPTSTWNIDAMDGNGPSGMTIDITKGNVYEIQYQWLGFGAIEYFIEDDDTGQFVLVHRDNYANNFTIPSIFNPSLPMRMIAENATNTTDMIIQTGSWGAYVQGRDDFDGLRNATTTVVASVGTSEIPLLTLRNDSTFQGKTNRVRIRPDFTSLSTDTSGNRIITILTTFNATLTGANFESINTDTSVASVDVTASALTGGVRGIPVQLSSQDSVLTFFKDVNIILNPGDTFTFSAFTSGGTSIIGVGLSWEELQ